MIFFAESSPSSLEIGGWILALVAVMAGVNQAFSLARNVKGEPPLPANSSLDLRVSHLNQEVTRIDGDVRRVDKDVKKLADSIATNGELRKNHMLSVIDDRYQKLDAKIERVSEHQTEQLIAALKGKND